MVNPALTVGPARLRTRVGWAGRAARALTTLVSAAVVAVGALAVVPAPARATTPMSPVSYPPTTSA